jgi:hypothetical protein
MKALEAYKADLRTHPKRLNGLYGAGLAAERSGNREGSEILLPATIRTVYYKFEAP